MLKAADSMRPSAQQDVVQSALLHALRDPAQAASFSPARCSSLLHQARANGLLGRVAYRVTAACEAARLPIPGVLAGHFESALRLCRTQQAEVQREARFLLAALHDLRAPVLMLKGAAYVLAALPAAHGRLFSDIDLMVPKADLSRAESKLQLHGWMGVAQTAYDERYYRQWMHELPPMTHVHRQTTLDVHHTLLPETARLRPDAAALFASAQGIPGWPGLQMLCPADMVLHSMTHLFMNDETRHALRDLCDLDALLRHFGPTPGFWEQLLERARLHQLSRPLHYGLRYAARYLGTPVPAATQGAVHRLGPPAPLRPVMDALWSRALDPEAKLRHRSSDALASWALYVRGHWLRMPAPLLLRHLGIKALRLHEKRATTAEEVTG